MLPFPPILAAAGPHDESQPAPRLRPQRAAPLPSLSMPLRQAIQLVRRLLRISLCSRKRLHPWMASSLWRTTSTPSGWAGAPVFASAACCCCISIIYWIYCLGYQNLRPTYVLVLLLRRQQLRIHPGSTCATKFPRNTWPCLAWCRRRVPRAGRSPTRARAYCPLGRWPSAPESPEEAEIQGQT